MKKPVHTDPLDAFGAAYETMYEHIAANLHKLKDKGGPLLQELVDEAREKVSDIGDIADEDIDKISDWLKRDLDDVAHYIADTEYAVKDWLGFETALIKSEAIRLLLETADKTTVQLLRMKENAEKPSIYHTGEIVGPGTLICDECGEKLHFHKVSHIPPCPKCHKTTYRRVLID